MEHSCGIVGIINNDTLIQELLNSLQKIQHRGHDGTGISYYNENDLTIEKSKSLVNEFTCNNKINTTIGTGHVRYSTRKNKVLTDDQLQPYLSMYNSVPFTLVHNGNIPNIHNICIDHDMDIIHDSDTYMLVKFIEHLSQVYENFEDALKYVINTIDGSYSLCIIYNNTLYGLRDVFGVRPLSIGKCNNSYKLASETVSLMNYAYVRDVKPGEIVKISQDITTVYQKYNTNHKLCSFEMIYFMSRFSHIDNAQIDNYREKLGKKLGSYCIDETSDSIVCAIPNTSIPAAKGFSESSKIPYTQCILRNNTIKRTFILPTQDQRVNACKSKFTYIEELIEGKNIYLIDDSIVRGTTCRVVVQQLFKYGAKSVHLRITSPPIISPCYYGIDMSTYNELIYNKCNQDIDLINKKLGSTSLQYLTIEDMLSVLGENRCTSCFDNKQIIEW
jgi:amidophosphoribosyltransferase